MIQNTGRTHFDIHAGNVLFDEKTARLNVIDFQSAFNGDFMVVNQLLPLILIRYSELFKHHEYTQFPTELPILSILGTRKSSNVFHPVIVLNKDFPADILNAIQDGAEGRSSSLLETSLQKLPIGSIYKQIEDVLLPSNIPGGEILYKKRCKAILGMRKYADKHGGDSTKKRTEVVLRESFKTIDSYAVGSVLYTILIKLNYSHPEIFYDSNAGNILVKIIEGLKNPDITKRIKADDAMKALFSLRKALPNDIRRISNKLYGIVSR